MRSPNDFWQREQPLQPGLSLCLLLPLRYEIPDTQTADEKQMEILQDKANFRNFKPKPFNMLEFYDRAGHDIREMLLSCFFRGEQCTPEDFKVVSAPAAPSQRRKSALRGGCLSACNHSCLLLAQKEQAAAALRGCQGMVLGFRGPGAPEAWVPLSAGSFCVRKAPRDHSGSAKQGCACQVGHLVLETTAR